MDLIFIKERDLESRHDTTRLEYRTSAVTLPDVLEDFEAFLRGCGYVFDGHLEIIEEEVISEDNAK